MNSCRHRANSVCQNDAGNAHIFRCSYHGWTFRNTGEDERLDNLTFLICSLHQE